MAVRTSRILPLLLVLGAVVAGPSRAAEVTPQNVGTLALTWERSFSPGVTGALVVANGLVYVPAWDGNLYALDPRTGVQRWVFASGAFISGGVLPTADGNLCFGNAFAHVFCVRGDDGSLIWERALGHEGIDAVWSAPATANGRIFFGVASLQDQPCTNGRLVALDLATGADLWTLQTVPDKICSTDTGIACSEDAACGGGTCVDARGAGVTATVALDPTGTSVYMNTVGCYTFPSVGDSDTMFKVDAATGQVVWKNRVTPPEQFGFCANDTAVDCSTDAQCATVGGMCTSPKPYYHDFGFLNGPLRLAVPDGQGTRTLIVSGSKDGTLYAFREEDGTIAWTNQVLPVPVSPGFAGFGLFNGALGYDGTRLYAALNTLIPARVCDNDHTLGCRSDAGCGGGHCLPEPEHLMAFDPRDGARVWSAEIGRSWSSVAVVNGVVYAGTQIKDGETGASELFAHDAATGARLATLGLPATSVARAAVVGDTLIVGYGVLAPGGVRAYSLCGNGRLDPDEACDPAAPGAAGCCAPTCAVAPRRTPCGDDDGNACTDAACNDTGACVQSARAGSCDDGDACTTGDHCTGGACAGDATTVDAVACVLNRIVDRPCGNEALPGMLARKLGKRLAAARRLADRAARFAAKGQGPKAEKARRAATSQLDAIPPLTAAAATARKESRRIGAGCKQAIDALAGRGRGLLAGLAF